MARQKLSAVTANRNKITDIFKVRLARQVLRNLEKMPMHIASRLQLWSETVSKFGLTEVRKLSGYHDEPLEGARRGQRSIRLNKAYRAIYVIENDGSINFVEVIEVNKHEY
jgi:toxin HigB-1